LRHYQHLAFDRVDFDNCDETRDAILTGDSSSQVNDEEIPSLEVYQHFPGPKPRVTESQDC